jgi:PAS domain S-box-containing protein
MFAGDVRLFKFLRFYCEATAIAVLALGCMILYGWALNAEALKFILPGLVAVKPNTALGLAFSGRSLWLLRPGEPRARNTRMANFLAVVVTFLGAATLVEYVFGLNLRIDQLLFRDPLGATAASSPGRMAPSTAMAFLAIGIALLLLDWSTRRGERPAQLVSVSAGLIAMGAINNYVYQPNAQYGIPSFSNLALQTMIALLLLSAAVFFARPRAGTAGDLMGEGPGSAMARRLIPAVLIVPIFLGWISLQGVLAGLYGAELGLAMYATATIIIFAGLILTNAREVNEEHKQPGSDRVALYNFDAEARGPIAERSNTQQLHTFTTTEEATLLDLLHEPVVVLGMDRRIVFWNRGAESLYGWPAKSAVGKTTLELLQTEFLQPVEDIEAEFLRRGHWEGEAIHSTRDGVRLRVGTYWVLQRDVHGAPTRILNTHNGFSNRGQTSIGGPSKWD